MSTFESGRSVQELVSCSAVSKTSFSVSLQDFRLSSGRELTQEITRGPQTRTLTVIVRTDVSAPRHSSDTCSRVSWRRALLKNVE
jgi:hypothetical protein